MEEYYNSLEASLKEHTETHKQLNESKMKKSKKGPYKPLDYSSRKDIYDNTNEKEDFNQIKSSSKKHSQNNEKDFDKDVSDNEDEENNYYSLGSDNHND